MILKHMHKESSMMVATTFLWLHTAIHVLITIVLVISPSHQSQAFYLYIIILFSFSAAISSLILILQIMSPYSESLQVSSASPSSSSQHSSPMIRVVQLVPKSTSDRLLEKFFDATQYDFDYNEQSGLWSPPMQRSVFLNSQGKIFTEHEMHAKLTTLMAAQARSTTDNKLCCRVSSFINLPISLTTLCVFVYSFEHEDFDFL